MVDDQLLQEKQTVAPQHQNTSLHGSKDEEFEDEQRPSKCVKASKPSLYIEKFEKECQPRKNVENEKNLCSSNPLKDNEKINEDQRHQNFEENYDKASGVPYWVNTWQDHEDNLMQQIKNWQFNPPVYEKDEWSTEPKFNPLLHSTMISDNRDNEARTQCTKVQD